MLRHDRIPIWINGSRLKFLREFHGDLERYFQAVTYEAFPFRVLETEEARVIRESVEPRLRRCRKVVAATGRVSLARLAPGERAGDVERVNVIDVAFELGRYNLAKDDLLQALAQAEGAYRADRPSAWLRTVNPLFWLDFVLNYVEQIPFLPLRIVGVRPSRAASTGFGRGVRVVTRLAALVALALLVLHLAGWLDGSVEWLRRLPSGLSA